MIIIDIDSLNDLNGNKDTVIQVMKKLSESHAIVYFTDNPIEKDFIESKGYTVGDCFIGDKEMSIKNMLNEMNDFAKKISDGKIKDITQFRNAVPFFSNQDLINFNTDKYNLIGFHSPKCWPELKNKLGV